MKMKKMTALFLACVMIMSLMGGCGGSGGESGDDGAKVYNIGVVQQLEHPALDLATQGFIDAVNEKFGEENVKIDVQNGQNEQANCATISNNFVAAGVDLILANATTALQTAAAATNQIPILGTSITDYATALDIADWTVATGTNISGTSDLAPLEEQEDMLVELFPDAKKVGILYCSAEPNSAYQAKVFGAALEADGIAWEAFTAADSNELQAVATTAVETCDVIYVPTDNTVAGATEVVNNVCLPAGVPIIAGEEGICSGCGVASLSISYYDIGWTAGEMAYDILVNGADVSTMDIKFAPQVTKKFNDTNCKALGVTVPEDYVVIEGTEAE